MNTLKDKVTTMSRETYKDDLIERLENKRDTLRIVSSIGSGRPDVETMVQVSLIRSLPDLLDEAVKMIKGELSNSSSATDNHE
jgi:hypothetical protein